MAQTIVGLNAFTLQPQADTFEQGTGRKTVKTWKGPREGYEAAWDAVLSTDPDSMSGANGTPAEITATYLPADEDVENAVWELIPTAVDRPLATHPAFNTGSVQQEQIEAIDKAVAQGDSQKTDWDTKYGVTGLNDYRNLKAKGTDSFRMWSYVVRRTITTSLVGINKVDDQDSGLIVAWSDIPLNLSAKFSQPSYNRWDGDNLEIIPIEQWLANPSTVRYERKRYTITTEWQGALRWYGILYLDGSALTTEDGSSVG